MLQAIRDRATGWIAYTIIFLICIPFVLWGVNSYFDNPAVPDVATIRGTAISQQDFQRAYQQSRARAPNADDTLLKQQVLQQLIDRQVLEQAAENLDLQLSDPQLYVSIQSNADFQVNGVFDLDRYQRLLMQSGMAPASYEQGLRRAMSVSQLQQGLIESAFITNQSLSQLIALQNQKRNVEMLVLSLNQALEQQTVSDQEIDDYYKENSSRFQSPEKLKVQYLALNLEQMAALIEVSESELEQAYQERITQYTTAETRAASHILITLSDNTDAKQVDAARERAAKIYADLQAGELTFADLEASAKEDDALEAGKLGTITPNMMEPSFTQALYDLAEINAVTEPVQTSFGFHIIRLDSITDEEVVPLAEVKDELMQDIRQRRVEPEFFAAAETLANLSFEHQDSLQTAAEALDIEIQESDWFERSGTTEGIAQYRQVVEAAYGLEVLQEGYNSPVLEVEPSHLIVIRKADYQPAQPLSLEDARDDIENTIKRQKAREQLNARADELLTQLKSGIAVEQLAEQNEGTAWQKYEALERSTPGIDNAARELAFRLSVTEADTPAVGSVSLANGDQALLAVLGIDSVADAADDASEQVLRATLERQIGLRQYQAFVGSQRGQAEVQTFPDRL